MKKKIKNKLFFLLLIILTGIVLYFSLRNDFYSILKELYSANIWWLLVALFLTLGQYFFISISMNRIIRKYKPDYSLGQTIRLKFKSKFFDAITPTSSGGQPYQIYSLNSSGISVLDSTNICLQDFVVYQFALVLVGIIAIILNYIFNIFPQNSGLKILVAIGFIINLSVAVVLYLISFTKKFNNFVYKKVISLCLRLHILKDKEKVENAFLQYTENVKSGTSSLLKDKKCLLEIFLFQFIGLIINYLIPLFILFAIGDYSSFNLIDCLVASAYVFLMGSYIPLPGGTGGIEFGFVSFFGTFLTGSKLTALMLIWRFITYYFTMIIGAVVLNLRKEGEKL